MANTLFQDSATAPTISVQIQDCDNSHRKWEKNSDADEKAQNERTRAILTKHPLRQHEQAILVKHVQDDDGHAAVGPAPVHEQQALQVLELPDRIVAVVDGLLALEPVDADAELAAAAAGLGSLAAWSFSLSSTSWCTSVSKLEPNTSALSCAW